MQRARPLNLMRPRSGGERVTNVELFFDLVYVFAVTQISHYLLTHPTVTGALRAGLLLAMTWLLWVYTTWVTNWLDPQRIAVRLMLLALAGASLVMSAALPGAFSARGLIVERGTHASLYALGGRYYDLYTRQHGLEENLFLAPGEGDVVEEEDSASSGRR